MRSVPWLKFYPADWRAEPTLKRVSRAARSFWIDCLCLIHEGGTGRLEVNGQPATDRDLAAILGDNPRTVRRLLCELESAGVFSRDDDGFVVSRRIIRDRKKAELDANNGRMGGNPALIPRDSANRGLRPRSQKPEARSQKENKGADAPSFEAFWSKALDVWKHLGSPPGSKQEARNVWQRLSSRERWIAFLVPDLYAASIVEARRKFPEQNAKHVCRYLRHKLFVDWAHHCEDDDETEGSAAGNAGQRDATAPAPDADAGGDDPVGELFPNGAGIRGGGGNSGGSGRSAAGGCDGDGGVAGIPGEYRRPGQPCAQPAGVRADDPWRPAVAMDGAGADAVELHGQPGRRSAWLH